MNKWSHVDDAIAALSPTPAMTRANEDEAFIQYMHRVFDETLTSEDVDQVAAVTPMLQKPEHWLKKGEVSPPKAVSVGGRIFPSKGAAVEQLGVTRYTLNKRLASHDWPTWVDLSEQ